MLSALFLVGLAGGILWADRGGSLASGVAEVAVAIALSCAIGLLAAMRSHDTRNHPTLRTAAVVCAVAIFFVAGFEAHDARWARARRDADRVARLDPEAVRMLQARVRARRVGRWGDEVELDSVRATDGGAPLPGMLFLRLSAQAEPAEGASVDRPTPRADELLRVGAWIRAGVRVAPLHSPRNPGGPDRDRARARRGPTARARLVDPDWVVGLELPARRVSALAGRIEWARAAWRRRAADRLAQAGDASGIARALALGDRGGVSAATRDAFRRLGLAHLLAVSGLHVGFVAGLAAWVVLRLEAVGVRAGARFGPRTRSDGRYGLRERIGLARRTAPVLPFDRALIVACVAAFLYAWLTAAGVSVRRAALLFGLFALFRWSLRRVAPSVGLAWVAGALLLCDTSVLFDAGAQLSFGACGALIGGGFWQAPRARDEDAPGPRANAWVRTSSAAISTCRASLVVSLGTAPILAHYGMPLALFSPVLNIVAIPWAGVLALPGSLLALFVAGPAPSFVVSLLLWPSSALATVAEALAPGLPAPSVRQGLPWVALLAASSGGLVAMRCGRWRIAVVVWLGVCLAGARPIESGPFRPRPPQIVFFDVGQGDAALVQGRHATLLIDTGPGPVDGSGGGTLLRALRGVGVHSIDVLAVTHGDLDHRGGADRILTTLPVTELWMPAAAKGDEPLSRLANLAHAAGTRVVWLGVGSGPRVRGDLEIEVLWPQAAGSSHASRNARSMVLRVEFGGVATLFTADIGAAEEARLVETSRERLAARVLKVAHHGSRSASSHAFLDAVAPEVAVVSAPCVPTRGLPNGAALDGLRRVGARLAWTGRDGAVFVAGISGAAPLRVRSWGRPRACRARR